MPAALPGFRRGASRLRPSDGHASANRALGNRNATSRPDPTRPDSGHPVTARYALFDDVAVIRLDHPPVNGLDHPTRRALDEALRRALDDAGVRAVVLAGAGRLFSGGADIREFGSPLAYAEPHLPSLIDRVERAGKPVVAALHGSCVGGGLELALACHWRVAARGTRLGLPEVKIGLVPGAGGTQRLPRALGVGPALDLIVRGEPAPAEALFALPGQVLLQRLLEGDPADEAPIDGAVAFAREIAGRRPLPRLRDRPVAPEGALAALAAQRAALAKRAGGPPAPARCVDCVEQALVAPDFEAGLAFEREAFAALLVSAESKAMRHAFFAERAAGRVADLPRGTLTRPLDTVAVLGAGTMGSGIAVACLAAGLSVRITDVDGAALEAGVAAIRRFHEAQAAKGRLAPAEVARRLARLAPTPELAAMGDADLAIEAVYEDLDVKRRAFEALDAVMKPGAVLATNTSTLDVDRIAAFTRRPQDVLGLHFFSPAAVMRLIEVVRGRHTAPDVLATALGFARRLGKIGVVAGVCDGFIGNRMLDPYLRQAGFLLDEGASPQQVDAALEGFGFAMGPFRMSDLAGNDVGWAIRRRRRLERPGWRASRSADLLCERGRFGQKTGAGWYDYAPGGREPRPSVEVQAMLDGHRAALGLAPRAIGDDEIVHRLVYALVNEGARILEEGVAARASDIDVVYLAGYGFPRHRGGPMHYAQSRGLDEVLAALRRFAAQPHADAKFWEPAPLLRRLAGSGRGFD